MSWKPEVIADATGKWCANGLAFGTYEEAMESALDLSMRWTAVRDWRAVESDEPVNYVWKDGRQTTLAQAIADELNKAVGEKWFRGGKS